MISVIVPAYNAAATLPDCLRALQRQTVSCAEYEIIVVDDGSTDDSASIARSFGAHVLRQARRGPAAARNLGVSVAQGKIIMFTDADCSPDPDWIEQMRAPFANTQVTGVKGIYRTTQTEWIARFIQAEFEDKYRRMACYDRIDFIDTYSAAYRRSAFTDNDGFDVDFPHHSVEDVEFSFRLAERGYWLKFAPKAVVRHQHPVSLWQYLWRKWRYGYWRVWVYQRHPQKMMGDSHTAPELKLQLGALALFCLGVPLLFWKNIFAVIGVASVLVFVLSTLPFAIRTWKKDWLIALIAPTIILLRTMALAVGLMTGMLVNQFDRWSTAWAGRVRLP